MYIVVLGNWSYNKLWFLARKNIHNNRFDTYMYMYQNCHWLPQTAPQNFQRMLHFDAIQIEKKKSVLPTEGIKRNKTTLIKMHI